MFRIHETATGEWSPWIYRRTSRFRSSGAEGACVTAIDLSNAGIRYGLVKGIPQIACAWRRSGYSEGMKFKVVVHNAEEGGYWAEVPAVPGCVSQGETMEELLSNIRVAIEGCLSVEIQEITTDGSTEIVEVAL